MKDYYKSKIAPEQRDPSCIRIINEFEKKNDSIMSIESEETYFKPVISEENHILAQKMNNYKTKMQIFREQTGEKEPEIPTA